MLCKKHFTYLDFLEVPVVEYFWKLHKKQKRSFRFFVRNVLFLWIFAKCNSETQQTVRLRHCTKHGAERALITNQAVAPTEKATWAALTT